MIFQEAGIVLVRKNVKRGSDSDRAHDFGSSGWTSSLPTALVTSSWTRALYTSDEDISIELNCFAGVGIWSVGGRVKLLRVKTELKN